MINNYSPTGAKIETFARLLEAEQLARLIEEGLDCETNRNHAKVSVKEGKKYVKVDVGAFGKYMIDLATNEIFGIKGYGVIHRGHRFGTLDTVNDYNWGGYRAEIKGGKI